jgi:hypothetical protein
MLPYAMADRYSDSAFSVHLARRAPRFCTENQFPTAPEWARAGHSARIGP